MGYTYRNHGAIKDYWPDDSEFEMYLTGDQTITELIDACKAKWGDGLDMSCISIASEYIHTSCLTYDCYDSSDYTQFLHITYTPK